MHPPTRTCELHSYAAHTWLADEINWVERGNRLLYYWRGGIAWPLLKIYAASSCL